MALGLLGGLISNPLDFLLSGFGVSVLRVSLQVILKPFIEDEVVTKNYQNLLLIQDWQTSWDQLQSILPPKTSWQVPRVQMRQKADAQKSQILVTKKSFRILRASRLSSRLNSRQKLIKCILKDEIWLRYSIELQ